VAVYVRHPFHVSVFIGPANNVCRRAQRPRPTWLALGLLRLLKSHYACNTGRGAKYSGRPASRWLRGQRRDSQ
jgi:hypothetical protein